jgi:hypothetical protein
MSSLWTPGGERPVERDRLDEPAELTPEQEELLGELQAAREQLAKTPAALVVANHAIGLFQLAAIHLDRDPPNLDDARLAIDALSALVDGLVGRLGDEEAALREALAQLRLAYVEVSKRA